MTTVTPDQVVAAEGLENFEMYVAEVTVEDHPNAPINGRAVYIITEETDKYVTLCHPWTLTIFTVPLQKFIRNVGLTFWPDSKRDAPPNYKFNMENVLRKMQELLEEYAARQKQHPAQSIRRIIASMRGVPVEQVPQYKEQQKTARGSSGEGKERGPRKPGVIDAIKELLEDGYTVDEFVVKLAERFPDREADGMKNTVKCQLARLPKNMNRPITKTDAGSGRIVYKWGK